MKALILAAGLGTRLRPHTLTRPKALFPVGGRPVLEHAIQRLVAAGCDAIGINTHHLSQQVKAYLSIRNYGIPIHIRHEPTLLGTGGAIRNFADFWDDAPFWVMNADVVTDIPLEKVLNAHRRHDPSATLVLHHSPEFNTVQTSADHRILSLRNPTEPLSHPTQALAFTGIQILSPDILDYLPSQGPASSIDAFEAMIADGRIIRGWRSEDHYWEDIGDPKRYRQCAMAHLLGDAFDLPPKKAMEPAITLTPISGDGSDRRWFRASSGNRTAVIADHGLNTGESTSEVEAFVAIGRHLHRNGVAVPSILAAESVAGLVAVTDLGDTHFQSAILSETGSAARLQRYHPVLEALAEFAFTGMETFDPRWTWQTAALDRTVIVEQECRYFMRAFVRTVLPDHHTDEALFQDFNRLADRIESTAITGLVHRDCQSRNIMQLPDRIGFIDFQGARPGPIQYDVASLMIDPYVALPDSEQAELARMAATVYRRVASIDSDRFHAGLDYCALSRNLQILGAFGHLSRNRGKSEFAQYIPTALDTLDRRTSRLRSEFPVLARTVECIPRTGVWWCNDSIPSPPKEGK